MEDGAGTVGSVRESGLEVQLRVHFRSDRFPLCKDPRIAFRSFWLRAYQTGASLSPSLRASRPLSVRPSASLPVRWVRASLLPSLRASPALIKRWSCLAVFQHKAVWYVRTSVASLGTVRAPLACRGMVLAGWPCAASLLFPDKAVSMQSFMQSSPRR